MVPTAASTSGSRIRRTSVTIPGVFSSLAETRSACIDTLGTNLPASHKRSTVTPTENTSKIAARLPQLAHLWPVFLNVFMRHLLRMSMNGASATTTATRAPMLRFSGGGMLSAATGCWVQLVLSGRLDILVHAKQIVRVVPALHLGEASVARAIGRAHAIAFVG